jgi:hypothetical protein
MVMIALRSARQGLGRLFTALKPSNNQADEMPRSRQPRSELPSKPTISTDYRDRVNPRTFQNEHSSSTPRPGTAQNPSHPRPSNTPTNFNNNSNSVNNPLDGFFDDIQPFELEDNQRTSAQPEIPKPPQPIPPAPGLVNRIQPEKERPVPKPPITHTNRTAAEPQQKSDLLSPIDRLRPSQPISPRPPSTPLTPPRIDKADKTERSGERNFFGAPPTGGTDSLVARARQAIDYAYAGRLQASTDEFRKVVEHDPLFDFGSLEEFEQMPVLGYKALANAYSAARRHNFALLLLEMGIDKYPNDLELRNMLRTFKREIGQ